MGIKSSESGYEFDFMDMDNRNKSAERRIGTHGKLDNQRVCCFDLSLLLVL
jgi:hypothetical protein